MQNLQDDLKNTLASDNRLFADGRLIRNKIIELALKLDEGLISSLLSNKNITKHFFQKVSGVLVFDKIKFMYFVDSREFLPDSFTSFRNKIGLSVNDELISEGKEVVLSFPYKDCYLQGGQTKEEKNSNEIFWNEVLARDVIDRLLSPKAFTRFTLFDKSGKQNVKSISIGDNLIIRGNNLLALHSIKRKYSEKVKLIYIDPPYNTGNDSFRYNDSFNHSTWLTFMKNRMEVARELLSNDGFILIQIDNKELAYLKVLCDEIFGGNNYRNSIIVKKGTKSLQKQFTEIQKLNAGFDTILLYSKSEATKLPNLFKELKGATASSWNNHWRGTDRPTMRFPLFGITPPSGQWRWERTRTEKAVTNYEMLCRYIHKINGAKTAITDEVIDRYYVQYLSEHNITDHSEFELVRLSKNRKPEHYIPPRMKILLSENWMDLSVAGRITSFEHEKNEEILRRIIEWLTKKGDTVLDFFMGSGSTVAVAHKLERHYIGIEQMDYGKEDAVHRLQSVIRGEKKGISQDAGWKGGGSFIYAELAKLNQRLVEEIKQAAKSEIKGIINKLKDHPYLDFRFDFEKFNSNKNEFEALDEKDQKKVLLSLLDQNQLYINTSETDDETYGLSEEDVRLTKEFYNQK